jgi:hypothetical protein
MKDLDHNGREYKCGPNWVPNWLFDEPLFQPCCKQHDIDWKKGEPKLDSDLRLLRCTLAISSQEPSFWWRVRDYIQSWIMFSVLILNPVSYLIYWFTKKDYGQ